MHVKVFLLDKAKYLGLVHFLSYSLVTIQLLAP